MPDGSDYYFFNDRRAMAPPHVAAAHELLERFGRNLMDWEKGFLNGIIRARGLSPKQRAILAEIQASAIINANAPRPRPDRRSRRRSRRGRRL